MPDETIEALRRERNEWKQLYERQLKVNEEVHRQLREALDQSEVNASTPYPAAHGLRRGISGEGQ